MSSGIPQDHRSPHIQQRWVEAYNAGAQDIPPYGLLEILGSSHPEGTCGRTVLSVSRPTCDNLCQIAIAGPKKIPAGGYGPVTLDYPAWVLVNQAGSVGDNFGTKEDSFFAEQYHHGLRILGDLAATDDGAVMRVDRDVRHNEWFLAILVDRMCPTDSEVEVTSPEALDACMTTNSDVGPSLATNIFGLAGEIGDLVLLKRRGDVCDETYIVVQVEHKTACVVHDVEDRGACLVKEQLEIATMYCRLPDEACIILEFTDCVGSLGDCNLEFTLTVSCCGISG